MYPFIKEDATYNKGKIFFLCKKEVAEGVVYKK